MRARPGHVLDKVGMKDNEQKRLLPPLQSRGGRLAKSAPRNDILFIACIIS